MSDADETNGPLPDPSPEDLPARQFGWSNQDTDFNGAVADPDVVAEAWSTWRAEVAFAEQFVADAPNLGMVGKHGDALREVLVHVIEEYARHNGLADVARADRRAGRSVGPDATDHARRPQ